MTSRFITSLWPCLLGAVLGSAQAQTISFGEAWTRVIQQDEGLAAEQAGVDRAKQLREAAKAMYLPKVDLGASYTHLDQPMELDLMDLNPIANHPEMVKALQHILGGLPIPHFTPDDFVTPLTKQNVVTSSVKMLWPLFAGGRIDAAQDIRQAQVSEAQQLLVLKQQATFESLSQTYFGVVLAAQVVQTKQEIEEGLAHHLDHAKKLEAQGQIARVERLSAQSAYDRARIDTQKSRRGLEIAELALGHMLKLSRAEPDSGLFVNQELPRLEGLVSQTLEVHPGLKLLSAKKEQAKGMIRMEKGKYAPEVFLFGNYNLYEDDSLAAKTAPDWLVGVGVSMPLVSRDGRSETVQAAKSAELQVNLLQAKTRQDLELLVEKTWREAAQGLEEYQSLSSTQALAEENVLLRDKAFGQGLSTSLDVVDAQNQLAGVKTQRAAAAYQYVVSLARLLALSGQMNSFNQYQHGQVIEVNS
ncbi:TolC family protein [Aeromonas allosaccharophila]|uniref:TolC family protein n=1 Tax=Aeromonas allosaccharophila TaxID=656 RepID=UPI0005A8A9F4|nr:TolC family protein [Aeromonas allosaccharophila]MCE9849867.1 TolC family protein [Aeromonas allosaccharophila]MEB8287300.1 TolC family protein [Aeromonas veronii]WDO02830.1 TolC family protein [Aeromonas allosaccharophila]BBT79036.1 membrane protein [Aeromonas veronii]